MYCIKSDNELRMTTCNVALLCMAGLHPEWSEIGGFQQYLLNCEVVKINTVLIDRL